MTKKILSLVLCLVLLLSFPVAAYAEETEPAAEKSREEIIISSRNTFLWFAENCRLDSYSRNLDVVLQTNIDLTGTDFTPIPIFCGTFYGNGHTISGMEITAEGSVQGVFRYLGETAVVEDLHVSGKVFPDGSKASVGGIAGNNAGIIRNCTFSGEVSGGDYIGGIAGVNALTGVIENCSVEGVVHGNHFIGGITGDNQGVIRKSVNHALINTTPAQNTVDLTDITLETLTGSESANTVTDAGGIAGTGTGVIRGCANRADVGYQQMGYNIGGIAGSFLGYITDCRNYGAISGRKEVGGIVGQMEPVVKVEFSVDALQQLDEQLDAMSGLTSQAAANAQSSAGQVTGQIANLQKELETAQKAVDGLLPKDTQIDPNNPQLPQLPDADALLAAQNALSGSISGIQQSLTGIAGTTQSAAGTLVSDMQAIAGQAGQMGQTLNEASENIGGSVEDVSDLDTDADTTGKIADCTNRGAVLADLNAGGIVGAISLENDMDPEDDVDVFGELSMNFDSQLRAVVRRCVNEASVTAKKQNAGGIAGWMQMGLVKDCDSFATLEATQYAGGIAGNSQGFIRQSNAKSRISGTSYVGGIAGYGRIVTDCRSMTLLSAAEKFGEVLGDRERSQEETAIASNFYLSVEEDLGGIDGVSYEGCAQSLQKGAFLALEDLPERFSFITVQFLHENGRIEKVILEPGQKLREESIPEIPQKDDYAGIWEDLYTDIVFDTTFTVKYTPLKQMRQSERTGENGLPVLLMESAQGRDLYISEAEQTPVITEGELLAAWQFESAQNDCAVRCLLPEGADTERLCVLLLDEDGNWYPVDHIVDGSYVVTDARAGDQGISIVQLPMDYTLWYVAAGAAAALILVVVIVIAAKKRKQKKQAKKV